MSKFREKLLTFLTEGVTIEDGEITQAIDVLKHNVAVQKLLGLTLYNLRKEMLEHLLQVDASSPAGAHAVTKLQAGQAILQTLVVVLDQQLNWGKEKVEDEPDTQGAN